MSGFSDIDASAVTIDMLLADKVSQRYLLRFAERFYCAETVQCAIALRDLKILLHAADADAKANPRGHDKKVDVANREASRYLVETYFAEKAMQPIEDVPPVLRKRLAQSVMNEDGNKTSADTERLLAQTNLSLTKYIASDIVKRFRESDECQELLLVHPSRTLAMAPIRQLFETHLTPVQKQALGVWVEANTMQSKQDAFMEKAGAVFGRIDAKVVNDAVNLRKVQDSLEKLLEKLSDGPGASPLASVMEAAISTLTLAFCEFLDGDYGNAARNLAGVKHKLAPVKTDYVKKDSADENIEPIDPASTDYAEGW